MINMEKIKDNELSKITGGFSGLALAGIGVAITLIAGIIDGIARPKGCKD